MRTRHGRREKSRLLSRGATHGKSYGNQYKHVGPERRPPAHGILKPPQQIPQRLSSGSKITSPDDDVAGQAVSLRFDAQISLNELRPGMILARGIYTSNGLLLMPEGQPLNTTYIEKLLNHNRVQPISQALTVYC
jgi:hypothetical protein